MDKDKRKKNDIAVMMDAYTKAGTPGNEHRALANLEGRWKTTTKSWMEPDTPPVEHTGTCEQKMIFGGRFLQQEYSGDMMGESFMGINLIGYDNFTKKYVSTWIDSMSTGIYYFEGTSSPDGKTITQRCNYNDPVKGPAIWLSITRIVDNDTLVYEMYLIPTGGSEEKMMEMTVKRD